MPPLKPVPEKKNSRLRLMTLTHHGGLVIQAKLGPVARKMEARAISWAAAAAAAASLQLCPTLCDPTDGGPPGSRPWDSPGKNTGMGCHFLLQCMKVKRESEVAQSWEWVAISFSHA